MQIFTKDDINRIRERMLNNPAYVERIDLETADVRKRLHIQKSGIGTWYHYFTCPVCGTRLSFDYDNNESFTCPNCYNVQTGEPYVGAWWETILCMTTEAAYKLALAYIGTAKEGYLDKAKEILLGYAENYKNYQVHGGIPYNKPGRFLSQVLSDCEPICNLSRAYALLKDKLSDNECKIIKFELLRPAAEHQRNNLTLQRHNHEVAICTSIAAAALAIEDEELLDFALNTKYGIKYQLEHSFLEDDFWFEGSIGYHQYALFWFFTYETLAKNTNYSLMKDKYYSKKLCRAALFFKNLYIGDNNTVRLNDGAGSLLNGPLVYEHLYAQTHSAEFLPFLKTSYMGANKRESSLEALVYGVDTIPCNTPDLVKDNYLSECGSNIAMVRGSENRYLCFKAIPYGGEHDHYDRLSLSFDAFDANISTDFGTASGYGSPYHYNYFKNTATHNTVVIDGENMAPCDSIVNCYRVNSENDIYLDAMTLPPDNYTMPDTFTIKQWSDDAYRSVSMRRIVSWYDKYFVDVFLVKSENELRKDWTWHINAKQILPAFVKHMDSVSEKGPQSYFKNASTMTAEGIVKCEYFCNDFKLNIHALADGLDLIFAEGPGNPTNETVTYLLERTNKKCPIYVNVIEAYKDEPVIDSVDIKISDQKAFVTIIEKSGKLRHTTVDLHF